jgi:hypothetical protein
MVVFKTIRAADSYSNRATSKVLQPSTLSPVNRIYLGSIAHQLNAAWSEVRFPAGYTVELSRLGPDDYNIWTCERDRIRPVIKL